MTEINNYLLKNTNTFFHVFASIQGSVLKLYQTNKWIANSFNLGQVYKWTLDLNIWELVKEIQLTFNSQIYLYFIIYVLYTLLYIISSLNFFLLILYSILHNYINYIHFYQYIFHTHHVITSWHMQVNTFLIIWKTLWKLALLFRENIFLCIKHTSNLCFFSLPSPLIIIVISVNFITIHHYYQCNQFLILNFSYFHHTFFNEYYQLLISTNFIITIIIFRRITNH